MRKQRVQISADPMRIAIKKPLVSDEHITKHLKNSKN